MRTSKRICNLSELKESDVVYLVRRDGKEPEAFVVVTTFRDRQSAFPVGKSLATGINMVMTELEPGEHFYKIEEKEDIAC